jgi:hypothetical protein
MSKIICAVRFTVVLAAAAVPTAAQAQTAPAPGPMAAVGGVVAPVTARPVTVALPDNKKKPVASTTPIVKISGVDGESTDRGFKSEG